MSLSKPELRRFIAQCDPRQPLPADDPRYEPLDEGPDAVRGTPRSCMDALFRTIDLAEPTAETRQLFTGFQGSGKTTELRRLEQRLARDPEVATRVVYVDAEDWLNLYSPLGIADLLRVLAYQLDRAATLAEGEDPDRAPGFLRRFYEFVTQTEVSLKTVGFQSYGASLMLELKNNPSFHQLVTAALRLRFQQFVDDAARAMAEAVVRLRRATGAARVVVLVDGLEKLAPAGEEQRAAIEASAETVFLEHAELLHLPCHVVYTFPLWLRFRVADLGTRYSAAPTILPMVRIHAADGTPWPPGEQKLIGLLARRVDLTALFGEGDAARQGLTALIRATGGYPRDLLRLLRDLLLAADAFPVRPADVTASIDRLAEEYSRIVRSTDLELLAEVDRTHGLPRADAAQIAAFGRLLQRWLVLAYRNGCEWYDLHPMVRRCPLVVERLRRP